MTGRGPVGVAGIEVDQDVPRLGPLTRAHDAALLEFIHNPRSPRVAEAQSPLHQRNARFLFAANDLDALLNEILILLAGALFNVEVADRLGELLMNLHLVAGFALLGDEV